MFERYTERARRVLFFARYEAAQAGTESITPEHLVLAVLRDRAGDVLKFARAGETADTIRTRLEAVNVRRERVSASVEIPFSSECKDALVRAASEADGLRDQTIRPLHLILATAAGTSGGAARVLRDAGVDPNAIREFLRAPPEAGEEARTVPRQLVAFAAAGSICRVWKGVVKPGRANEYLSHLLTETIAALAEMDGFLTYSVMRREVDAGTEFQVLTIWRSLDAITAFAGEDVTRAVIPPAAQALMVRYDDRAIHYEIVQ